MPQFPFILLLIQLFLCTFKVCEDSSFYLLFLIQFEILISIFLDKLKTDLTDDLQYVKENISFNKTFTFKQFSEDAVAAAPIANNAGSPGVAGFTPETLGVPKGKQPPLLKRKKVIKNV